MALRDTLSGGHSESLRHVPPSPETDGEINPIKYCLVTLFPRVRRHCAKGFGAVANLKRRARRGHGHGGGAWAADSEAVRNNQRAYTAAHAACGLLADWVRIWIVADPSRAALEGYVHAYVATSTIFFSRALSARDAYWVATVMHRFY